MPAEPFRRPPMVDFDHPDGQSLFWRISHALDRLVEQLENDSPVGLFFQKVARDIAAAEEAEDMSRYIPPGREDLYRRQAIADAEVKRLEAAHKTAEHKARELAKVLDRADALVEDAEAEADRLYDEWGRAQAVADRIHEERTAGLSYWIDTSPHLPVCSECDGTGGPRLAGGGIEDARTSCRTCRGWGREDDGRGNLPVWHEDDQTWRDPTTGREVDVPEPSLNDPPKETDVPAPPAPPETRAWTPAPLTMSDAELNTAAREWVSECSWKEDPEDLDDLTDEEVRRGVNRHYEGGWKQFVQDANGYDPPPAAPLPAPTGWDRVETVTDSDTAHGRGAAGMPPAADPYVPPKKNHPPPTTRTTGPTGATTMSNVEEARAGIMDAHSSAQTGLAELAQAHSSLENAQNGLRHATEGSNQAEADQAHGQLAEAMNKIEEARGQVASALQEFEGVGQRL